MTFDVIVDDIELFDYQCLVDIDTAPLVCDDPPSSYVRRRIRRPAQWTLFSWFVRIP